MLSFYYPQTHPISWDVFGYYLYLPAKFIYNDLGLENINLFKQLIEQYQTTGTFYQVTPGVNDYWVMKYSMGMAVLYSPFFFIAHWLAPALGYAADGFSKPYQWSLLAGSFLYTVGGLFSLRVVLLRFFQDKIVALTIALIVLGTNFLLTAATTALMPHNYLFTLYALLLLFSIKYHEKPGIFYACLIGLVVGLLTVARPSELVSILIPLLWNVYNKETFLNKIKFIRSHALHFFLAGCVMAIIGLPQLLYWKKFSGSWLFDSYNNPGEGFEFLKPYILQVLFSFRKGWLIYTPIMIFAVYGIFLLWKKRFTHSYAVAVFFIVNFYIIASWSNWWYADSFSQRALVQLYPVLAIPFGFFLTTISQRKAFVRMSIAVLILFFCVLNIFQSWQLQKGILHTSRMTFKYYKEIFGKTKIDDAKRSLLLVERSYKDGQVFSNPQDYTKYTAAIYDFSYEMDSSGLSRVNSYSPPFSFKMNPENIYSPGLERSYKRITDKDHFWLKGSVMIYPTRSLNEQSPVLVVTFTHKGKNYQYLTSVFKDSSEMKINQWNKLAIDYLSPEVRNESDLLKVYVWYRGEGDLYVDDLRIDIYEPKAN